MTQLLSADTAAIVDLTRTMTSMFDGISGILSLATYVMLSFGLYSLAKRRGVHKPWLAWLPVGNMWILGCIADQYRYVAQQQEKNRRKPLLILNLVTVVLALILVIMVLVAVVNIIDRAPSITLTNEQMNEIQNLTGDAQSEAYLRLMIEALTSDDSLVNYAFQQLIGVGVMAMLLSLASLAGTVLQYIAMYDLYASCDPANKLVYLLLSIFVNLAGAVLVFALRNRDQGMPQRDPYVVEQGL